MRLWLGVNSSCLCLTILLVFLIGASTGAAKSVKVRDDIIALQSCVKAYRLNCGELPPPELGLEALVTRPPSRADKRWTQIADKIPTDPWNRPYRYAAGDGYPGGFGIYSCGKDGDSATQGNDPDDWNSWQDPDERPDTAAERRMKLSLLGAGVAGISFYLGARVARRKLP